MRNEQQSYRLRFTNEDISVFRRLSHDQNPLHTDSDYASRTFFGQQVVYGVLGLLAGLKGLGPGKQMKLDTVSVRFRRPLFLGVEYSRRSAEQEQGTIVVDIACGSSTKLSARLRTSFVDTPLVPMNMEAGCAPRETPAEVDMNTAQGSTRSGKYRIDSEQLTAALEHLGVDPARIAPLHVSALCWASYLVGMELPGRQALFYSLVMSFSGNADLSTTELDFEAHVVNADLRVNMLDIEATLSSQGSQFGVAKIKALVRPEPLSYDLTEFKQVVGGSTALIGKIAFVSGSSRGLGALLAIGCAMHGSDVVLHFNRNEAEVERVQDVISSNLGRRCIVLQGDIRKQSTWDHVVAAIKSQFGRLDVFVNNAYPPILPLQLDELSEEMMSIHVFENIKASILAHKALLPLVRENKGCILNISSQYAVKPPKDFTHYAIAKSAVEGLARGLAATTPDVRFLTVRPPKILTEQTNVPIDLTPAVSPFGVVKEILCALLAIDQPGHYVVENFDL